MMLRWTWLVPPAMRPAGEASRAAVSGPSSIAAGAGAVGAQRGDVEAHLGDAQLEQRAAGRGDRSTLVPLALGQRLVRRAQGHQRGQLLAGDRAELAVGAELAEALQPPLQRDDRRADVAPLVGQHAHPDAPAAVQRAEQAVGGQLDVGEEDLVELRAARHLLERADVDAGQVHRAQEERDAVVLGRLGVRPGHQDAPAADPPARAPDLLAVDDEAVAVALGPRRQAAEVAAGAGLGEQLAPHLVAVERRPQVLGLLLGRAVHQQRATGEDQPDHVQHGRHPGLGALDQPRRLVLVRQALAAVLDGPVDAGVARTR